jgi:hypothetical protein
MDMTMAEQLVWAAVYANEWDKDTAERSKTLVFEERILIYCEKATRAVVGMRSASRYAFKIKESREQMGNTAFDHLRQMTFKLED